MKHFYIVEGTVRNNLGDILQGMTAAQYLDVNATAVDREKLKIMDNTSPGFLLANGWFIHDFSLFPPPPNIILFYISIHVANSEFLKQNHIREHFRLHGPIGCRDLKTLKLFLGWGIPAYYSGCITITTKAITTLHNNNKGDILIVDNVDHPIPDLILDKIELLLKRKSVRVSHYPSELSLPFNDYVTSCSNKVQSLLNSYCNASLVITTKIHCALPCLGMGVNVVLIHPNPSDPRLNTVRKFIGIISFDELLNLDHFLHPKKNFKALIKNKNFISRLVQLAVKEHKNPIRNSRNIFYLYIKYRSYLLAFICRKTILFFIITGLATKQMKRVFNIS